MPANFQLSTFLLVTTRVAALVFLTPGWGARFVPWRARLLLVGLLDVSAYSVAQSTAVSFDLALLPKLLIHEAIVGFSLALVPALILWAVQMALQPTQGLTGLAGVAGDDSVSGDFQQAAATERFFVITVVAIFFSVGGHRQLVRAVLDSFRWLPPGEYVSAQHVSGLIVDLLSQSFALGVRAVSPLVVALLLGLTAFAAINRLLPQLSYFAVGMNLQVLVLLASLVIFFGAIGWLIEGELATATLRIQLAWKSMVQHVP